MPALCCKNNSMVKNTIPRRARLYLNEPAERAIFDAMQEVEKLPPDIGLTDAVILLQQARDKVSDYIDSISYSEA
jgi:hypothetical protein